MQRILRVRSSIFNRPIDHRAPHLPGSVNERFNKRNGTCMPTYVYTGTRVRNQKRNTSRSTAHAKVATWTKTPHAHRGPGSSYSEQWARGSSSRVAAVDRSPTPPTFTVPHVFTNPTPPPPNNLHVRGVPRGPHTALCARTHCGGSPADTAGGPLSLRDSTPEPLCTASCPAARRPAAE